MQWFQASLLRMVRFRFFFIFIFGGGGGAGCDRKDPYLGWMSKDMNQGSKRSHDEIVKHHYKVSK